jgi:hypothetical protein
VLTKDRIQSAGEWIEMIRQGEESVAAPEQRQPVAEPAAAPVETAPAAPTEAQPDITEKLDKFIENNVGYFFGLFLSAVGVIVVGVGLLLWWLAN